MLQALIHHKLKGAFTDTHFHHTEDTTTSSIIGLLQYLPDELVWKLLKSSCGFSSGMPQNIGQILSVNFWDSWTPDGDINTTRVEPDVWLEFEKAFIIIEAKKYDGGGQYEEQWRKEVKSYNLHFGKLQKRLFFIALGGNQILQNKTITVDGVNHTIHAASWYNLLNAVIKQLKEESNNSTKRILSDIILAFEQHQMFQIDWLKSIYNVNINLENKEYIKFVPTLLGGLKSRKIYNSNINSLLWKI